jgi:aryl-alcohol dehydrogenase-like predicted oxidoreductase
MNQRRLGKRGPQVMEIGLGCMSIGIADVYTSSTQDDAKAVELIHRALDLGINFLDTANIYGDSEIKVGKALRGRRDNVILATKFGIVPNSSLHDRGVDGTPENARRSCDTSLERLGVQHIDLYYLHRVDPKVPIEETVGAMADLVQAGKVRHLGLSRPRPKRCAALIKYIRSPPCKRSTRCSVVNPKTVCCRSCANWALRSWPTVRWAADFWGAVFAALMILRRTTGGVAIPDSRESSLH